MKKATMPTPEQREQMLKDIAGVMIMNEGLEQSVARGQMEAMMKDCSTDNMAVTIPFEALFDMHKNTTAMLAFITTILGKADQDVVDKEYIRIQEELVAEEAAAAAEEETCPGCGKVHTSEQREEMMSALMAELPEPLRAKMEDIKRKIEADLPEGSSIAGMTIMRGEDMPPLVRELLASMFGSKGHNLH